MTRMLKQSSIDRWYWWHSCSVFAKQAKRKKRRVRDFPLLPAARSPYFRTFGFLTERVPLCQGRETFSSVGTRSSASPRDPIPTDRSAHHAHRRRQAHDARADRHALAHDDGAAHAGSTARGRHWPPQSGGRRRGYGHADARVHHRSRPGQAGVRAQACRRREHCCRPAHLPIWCHHHCYGGHGDFRQPFEVPRTLGSPQSREELLGAAMIAPTARTRSACECVSSSCWARRRSS